MDRRANRGGDIRSPRFVTVVGCSVFGLVGGRSLFGGPSLRV
jgi:hypothetical protein